MLNGNPDISELFRPFEERMLSAGVPTIAIETFRRHFHQLTSGDTGKISHADLADIGGFPSLPELSAETRTGNDLLSHTVVIKLNGGLGTSMGLAKAKSLIYVRNGMSFLDIIARQLIQYRERHGIRIPLLLMNSNGTRADSLETLSRYGDLSAGLKPDFLQHHVPKVRVDDLTPVTWPGNPELEWCPPGHGDLYTALVTSGQLEALLAAGYRYAFVSNADNLGAVLEPSIPGYMSAADIPFVMEVTDRTAADRKGGHLARDHSGRLLLRELAQCPADELEDFQDINRFQYFNTNSIWIDLRALSALLDRHSGALPLPLIRNRKTVDPKDLSTPPVYQLETAMGAAISLFEHAMPVRVPRTRFAPVKTTDDLLAIRSDAYELTTDGQIILVPPRSIPPAIHLDMRYFRLVSDLDDRFHGGTCSLRECRSLTIQGDVRVGRRVRICGDAIVTAPEGGTILIPDDSIIGSV